MLSLKLPTFLNYNLCLFEPFFYLRVLSYPILIFKQAGSAYQKRSMTKRVYMHRCCHANSVTTKRKTTMLGQVPKKGLVRPFFPVVGGQERALLAFWRVPFKPNGNSKIKTDRQGNRECTLLGQLAGHSRAGTAVQEAWPAGKQYVKSLLHRRYILERTALNA